MVARRLRICIGRKPGVHQNTGFVGLDICAITAGTAAEDGELDGHNIDVSDGKACGQFFSNNLNLLSV